MYIVYYLNRRGFPSILTLFVQYGTNFCHDLFQSLPTNDLVRRPSAIRLPLDRCFFYRPIPFVKRTIKGFSVNNSSNTCAKNTADLHLANYGRRCVSVEMCSSRHVGRFRDFATSVVRRPPRGFRHPFDLELLVLFSFNRYYLHHASMHVCRGTVYTFENS